MSIQGSPKQQPEAGSSRDEQRAFELVELLFEGLSFALSAARRSIVEIDPAGRGTAIFNAIEFITGLATSASHQVPKESVDRLCALYEYMNARLLYANINNDLAATDEVIRLLGELRSAWGTDG